MISIVWAESTLPPQSSQDFLTREKRGGSGYKQRHLIMIVTSMQLLKLLLIILNCQIKVKLGGFCLRIQGRPQTILKFVVQLRQKAFYVLQKTQHNRCTHVTRLYLFSRCLLIALECFFQLLQWPSYVTSGPLHMLFPLNGILPPPSSTFPKFG